MGILKYRLVAQKTGVGKNKGKTIYTANPVTIGRIGFDEFVKEVAEGSTVDPADVKAVVNRLHTVITRLTSRGFSVEVGELGTFRASFGSPEVLKAEDFKASSIKPAKIIFTPKPEFKNALRSSGYELWTGGNETSLGGSSSSPVPPPSGSGGSSSSDPGL